jgi:hypothetical protein
MKKTLKKIGVLVVVILTSHFCYGEPSFHHDFAPQKILSLNVESLKSDKLCAAHQMFAMGNLLNLKIYHYGLQRLNSKHVISTKEDLLKEVRTHHSFIGRLVEDPFPSNHGPFFIFEKEEGHFYLVNQDKKRHFTVNHYAKEGSLLAGIDNGNGGYYPSLKALISCTLS